MSARLDALAGEIAQAHAHLLQARSRMQQDYDREIAALEALRARVAAALGEVAKDGRSDRAAGKSALVEEFRALEDSFRSAIARLDGKFGF
jgi:hypothetical protein